jgi:hypothetical protein
MRFCGEGFCLKAVPAKLESLDFLTCQSVKTASTRAADTAGTSAHTIYGESVEPKDLILESGLNVTTHWRLKA